MIKISHILGLSFMGVWLGVNPTQAVPFSVTYNFTGNAATPTIVGSGVAANNINATVLIFSISSGVASSTNFTGALDQTRFISFTLTPSASLDLSTLTFNARRNAQGPTTLFLASSLNNFGSTIALTGGNLTTTNPVGNAANTRSFDISGAAFNNITTPTEFRIYGSGASSTSGILNLDDIVLTGEAVPYEMEMGAGVLVFAGYLATKNYLKRKQKT